MRTIQTGGSYNPEEDVYSLIAFETKKALRWTF
jgi:hypothetical protein